MIAFAPHTWREKQIKQRRWLEGTGNCFAFGAWRFPFPAFPAFPEEGV
jgi:hypothetical protein